MNQYNHKQYNQPGDLVWLIVAAFVLAMLLVAGEVLWQTRQRNKQLKQERTNDSQIFQAAEEARRDFR